MRELLDQRLRPDAVFISNNRMTAGALQAIEESRAAVPEEIAVVGYDDVPWAALLRTTLTTVSQPAYDIGYESARLLLSRINGYSGFARTVVLPTSLNVRASSAPKSHDGGSRALDPVRQPRRLGRNSQGARKEKVEPQGKVWPVHHYSSFGYRTPPPAGRRRPDERRGRRPFREA